MEKTGNTTNLLDSHSLLTLSFKNKSSLFSQVPIVKTQKILYKCLTTAKLLIQCEVNIPIIGRKAQFFTRIATHAYHDFAIVGKAIFL